MPDAGKSTLAAALAAALRQRRQAVCILGGDALRLGLCSDPGYGEANQLERWALLYPAAPFKTARF